jgi:hypothetical protein
MVNQSWHTEFGRTVHFANGTPYKIGIVNTREKKVAVDISVDGWKVNLSPILLRSMLGSDRIKPRVIKGFQLRRTTVDGGDTFEINTDYELFVASRPEESNAARDERIGVIRFKFFAVVYKTHGYAAPARDQLQATHELVLGARPGVLQSSGSGAYETTRGQHNFNRAANRRPVPDKRQPLEDWCPCAR